MYQRLKKNDKSKLVTLQATCSMLTTPTTGSRCNSYKIFPSSLEVTPTFSRPLICATETAKTDCEVNDKPIQSSIEDTISISDEVLTTPTSSQTIMCTTEVTENDHIVISDKSDENISELDDLSKSSDSVSIANEPPNDIVRTTKSLSSIDMAAETFDHVTTVTKPSEEIASVTKTLDNVGEVTRPPPALNMPLFQQPFTDNPEPADNGVKLKNIVKTQNICELLTPPPSAVTQTPPISLANELFGDSDSDDMLSVSDVSSKDELDDLADMLAFEPFLNKNEPPEVIISVQEECSNDQKIVSPAKLCDASKNISVFTESADSAYAGHISSMAEGLNVIVPCLEVESVPADTLSSDDELDINFMDLSLSVLSPLPPSPISHDRSLSPLPLSPGDELPLSPLPQSPNLLDVICVSPLPPSPVSMCSQSRMISPLPQSPVSLAIDSEQCELLVDDPLTDQLPSPERSSLDKPPSPGRSSLDKPPSTERSSLNKPPSSERSSVDKPPFSERGSLDKLPSSERSSLDKPPSPDRSHLKIVLTDEGSEDDLSNGAIANKVCYIM